MTGNPWLQIGLAVLGVFGAGGIGAALLNAILGHDQRKADAAKTLAETATSTASELVEAVRAELRATREEFAEYERRTDARMDSLDAQLTDQKRRFWSAIGYLRQLVTAWPSDRPRPEIPDDLREHL